MHQEIHHQYWSDLFLFQCETDDQDQHSGVLASRLFQNQTPEREVASEISPHPQHRLIDQILQIGVVREHFEVTTQ